MNHHNYFVYITTNPNKTVLYVGMSNDLEERIIDHYLNRGDSRTFAGRFYCYNLIYWERHQYVWHAIEREKEIKKWNRKKKEQLIIDFNREWKFLNGEIMKWPPNVSKVDRER